jgi:hypothetical protein
MRRLLLFAIASTLGICVYAGSPFRAAWILRDAIREADHATLERKVEWDQLRASLKQSLAQQAHLLKQATEAGAAVQPTFWQRAKLVMGASMLDRFIETYVTPEGLPTLYGYRKAWNEKVRGANDESTSPLPERLRKFYARVKRAEFQSPTRLEIEVADRYIPDRRYVGTMELIGTEWKLVSIRVIAEDDGSLLPAR